MIYLFANGQLAAQSLYEDAQLLSEQLRLLENEDGQQSLEERIEATATVLAILQHYDQPLTEYRSTVVDIPQLLRSYRDNPHLRSLLRPDLLSYPDTARTQIQRRLTQRRSKLASGAREEILRILQSDTPTSPIDYLSIPSTLEQYRLPPISTQQQLTNVVDGVSSNIDNGFLTAQAAVIEGLFQFVLNRAKDEVLINFLDRLLTEETPRFQHLFPTVIEEFGMQELTYSSSFLRRLRHAFYEDIQKMSIRLPYLILTDEYFKQLYNQPVAYHFLVLYSMMGLAQNGYEMTEIVPLTHRYLYDSYEAVEKKINHTLATQAVQDARYEQLIAETTVAWGNLKRIFNQFAQIEFAIDDSIAVVESRLGATDYPIITDYLDSESSSLKTVLGQGEETPFTLNLLPQLLSGELDEDYIRQYNRLEDFDLLFSKNYTSTELRISGLALLEKLNGTWHNDEKLPQLLYNWERQLERYRVDVQRWRLRTDTTANAAKKMMQVENRRIALCDSIQKTQIFWGDRLSQYQEAAFAMLAEIVNAAAFYTIEQQNSVRAMLDPSFSPALANLQDKRALLDATEIRLARLDNELYATQDEMKNSPARNYLDTLSQRSVSSQLHEEIVDFEHRITRLIQLKDSLEMTYAPLQRKEQNSARIVLQLTEAMSYLMYNLQTHASRGDSDWLPIEQLDSLLQDRSIQPFFLGLLQQQLSSIRDLGVFHPQGLAQLVDQTIRDIPYLLHTSTDNFSNSVALVIDDSLSMRTDTSVFYHKLVFAVNTLNRILELPILEQDSVSVAYPLVVRHPNLHRLPHISNQLVDMVYYLNQKKHGRAVSTLIRLFTQLDELEMARQSPNTTAGRKGKKKRNNTKVEHYLQEYGDFIAGLIDASTTDEVERLLSVIADPPGSSRLKRCRPFTVGLNAYVAAAPGVEYLYDKERNIRNRQFNFAPNIPVGITISKLFGRELKADGSLNRQPSWSLFLSFLDLGGLLTYSPPVDRLGQSDLNVRNVFKLGTQIQWNIPRSPFFLGAGLQYGPQFRAIDDKQRAVTSTRYFVGFGVDVPIKTLYQR